jgi:thiamine biosynthesis lipoprotein
MTPNTTRLQTFQRVRPLLGTLVAVDLEAPDEKSAQVGVEAAFAAIARLGVLMRPAAPGSDLERIATARPNELVPVDPWTHTVLKLAREISALTNGLFDPCLAHRPGRMRDVDLTTPNHVSCRAHVAIDLGGIAKGFAVDRAVDALQAHGCHAGLVNAGGDLRVFGSNTRQVQVRLPHDAVAQVGLANTALAVSAPRSDASPSEHRGYYRGTTGEALEVRTVAVVAAETAVADALTKCVMLCPAAEIEPLLRRYGARVLELGARA